MSTPLRIAGKRAAASLKSAKIAQLAQRDASSSATTTMKASRLPEEMKEEIVKAAGLPNADPTADSATSRLVNEQAPFMVKTYVRPAPMFVKGQGSYLYDVENRKYLDFTSGIAVNALGHSDPEIAELLYEQAKTLMHTSNLYHNPWTGALSQLLVTKTLDSGSMADASSVFICNSGSEANEAAIKFSRKAGKVLDPSGKKHEIVSFHNSFHGRTMGSLSATPNPKYQKPFAPMLPGFRYGTYNDVAGIDALVTENTAGVIVEPIQGEGGVVVGTTEFLTALAKRCREVGAVLIYDEIQCGLSRTGDFWAHTHLPAEAHPDILTTAKALGNGFPIGATIVTKAVADKMAIGDHGTTFGGNPLGSRLAHYIVSRLSQTGLQDEVKAKSALFRAELEKLQDKYPGLVKEIRGRGLLLGLQLNQDPTPIVTAARERGLLIITAGTNTLRFVPPLTINEEEIQDGFKIIDEAMALVVEGAKIGGEHGEVDSPN